MKIGWFFIDISGCINSFGPGLFVRVEHGFVLQWIAAAPSGKSPGQRSIGIKVTSMHDIMMDFSIWGHLTRPRGPFRAQGSALTRFGRATQPRPQGFQHCSSVSKLLFEKRRLVSYFHLCTEEHIASCSYFMILATFHFGLCCEQHVREYS